MDNKQLRRQRQLIDAAIGPHTQWRQLCQYWGELYPSYSAVDHAFIHGIHEELLNLPLPSEINRILVNINTYGQCYLSAQYGRTTTIYYIIHTMDNIVTIRSSNSDTKCIQDLANPDSIPILINALIRMLRSDVSTIRKEVSEIRNNR